MSLSQKFFRRSNRRVSNVILIYFYIIFIYMHLYILIESQSRWTNREKEKKRIFSECDTHDCTVLFSAYLTPKVMILDAIIATDRSFLTLLTHLSLLIFELQQPTDIRNFPHFFLICSIYWGGGWGSEGILGFGYGGRKE